jgi:hypothetical protein
MVGYFATILSLTKNAMFFGALSVFKVKKSIFDTVYIVSKIDFMRIMYCA